MTGSAQLPSGHSVRWRLPRSGEVGRDLPVSLEVQGAPLAGLVRCRRVPSREEWQLLAVSREPSSGGYRLSAFLPAQPPAGKLAYQFLLVPDVGEELAIPPEPVVVRFKGRVGLALLLPHVLAMFLGLLLANRAGLGVLFGEARPQRFLWLILAFFALGGLVLGPLVQKAAFGAWWTGFPLGHDVTDTKTLAVVVGWLWAAVRSRGGRRWPVLVASLLTLLAFALPHSLWGSELRWE